MTAVRKHECALEFARDYARDDKDIVLEAVKKDGALLALASERVKAVIREKREVD
ncbi:DUF4116 domain-containing protein [Dialister micraerophilus]|uniref:DUF4116 domain-containing protein n=1 Tax=Dialister micraerophilus TaxID=309120 RepID=UPI003C6C9226